MMRTFLVVTSAALLGASAFAMCTYANLNITSAFCPYVVGIVHGLILHGLIRMVSSPSKAAPSVSQKGAVLSLCKPPQEALGACATPRTLVKECIDFTADPAPAPPVETYTLVSVAGYRGQTTTHQATSIATDRSLLGWPL